MENNLKDQHYKNMGITLQMETLTFEAESVAYTVCQHYGLDTSEYSFGYVAGWSSGRELAELKASLEVIRSTAHELISALDEHLAELRQQREADLSAAQETAFVLDSGNTLFIQTCDSGYDYTLYGPDHTALDGGQLDAPGLTLPDAGQEALNLLGQTAAVSEVLLGDKLAAFQEAAEKANEIPTPIKIPDPAAEPTVTVLWSESDKLQDGEIMPLSVANRVFEKLDTAQHTDREKDGYTGGWYDKTAFRIDFTLNGQPDNYEGRQDFGDGEGSLVQHIGLQMLTTAAQAAAIWAITEVFRLAVNAIQDYVNRAEIAKEKMEESIQAYRFTMTSTNFGSNSMPRHTWSVFSPAISVEPLPRNGSRMMPLVMVEFRIGYWQKLRIITFVKETQKSD